MDVIAVLKSGGRARPLPFHFDEYAGPVEPNSMSWLCGELYLVSVIGHERGEE